MLNEEICAGGCMERRSMRGKLHISTIDADSGSLARRYGVGLEIAEFCWAQNLDIDRESHIATCREIMQNASSFWFHAPFAELAACSIDPKVRTITAERYMESITLAAELGINRIVVHGGFIPKVYFPEYYVEASVDFWKELLPRLSKNVLIALENVMEPGPETLIQIVQGVNDERLGLCLDVGHANCGYSKTPPENWIEPMAPFLIHVHLHNNDGVDDLHAHLGCGTIDMKRLLDRLLLSCPKATYTIENQHSYDSLVWLKENGYL